MTTSSEDVLLQVGHVRFKKGDGTLYVMNERIAWMMDHKETVSVSHRYVDIKMQKISPEGKPKIQLQVVLHNGTTSTFHFVNPMGLPAQIRDRDQVKEHLVQLLHKFKREVNKELEEKNRLLSENPALLQLYRDLVITQVISADEFWSEQATEYTQKNNPQKQEIGVSGAFLADIKPQTDGCNGLKYNLTTDTLDCIFKTYPNVRRKHLECVPTKMSEADFWTKFFQSHYFHRDRINAGTKDLFTECAKLDDQEMKNALALGINNPLVDLNSFEDKYKCYDSGETASGSSSGNFVHHNMIKRFNQHSIMVINACESKSDTSNSKEIIQPESKKSKSEKRNLPQVTASKCTSLNQSVPNDEAKSGLPSKREQILEKIFYEDLEKETTNSTNTPLTLSKTERYLHGPIPGKPGDILTGDDALIVCERLQVESETWLSGVNRSHIPRRSLQSLINPAAAVSALGELTPGGALMKGFQEESVAQLIQPELERELQSVYRAACKLLRPFWDAFPPTTPELEAKAIRMHEALHRFQSARLKVFEDRIMREFSPVNQGITSHLNQLLQAAYRKFATWQSRKMHVR